MTTSSNDGGERLGRTAGSERERAPGSQITSHQSSGEPPSPPEGVGKDDGLQTNVAPQCGVGPSDLTGQGGEPCGAFTQGYVEAALRDAPATGPLSNLRFPTFSDLSPEALARILRDCARFTELYGVWPLASHGQGFWIGRQKDKHSPDFPPLTAYLGHDGKVYLRDQSACAASDAALRPDDRLEEKTP